MKKEIFGLILLLILCVVSACGKSAVGTSEIPKLDDAIQLSDEELDKLAEKVSEKALIKAWGEPENVDFLCLWRVPVEGGVKFIMMAKDGEKIIYLHKSVSLFITTVAKDGNTTYCLSDFRDYSMDEKNLTFMPGKDIFGNDIEAEVGELLIFEGNGVIMESYPEQLSPPCYVMHMGRLSDEEIKELSEKVVLP